MHVTSVEKLDIIDAVTFGFFYKTNCHLSTQKITIGCSFNLISVEKKIQFSILPVNGRISCINFHMAGLTRWDNMIVD